MSLLMVVVEPDGSAWSIYDDALQPIMTALGPASIRRASRVEPDMDGWTADLSPVGGPRLGPYQTRREALDAEVRWLEMALERGDIATP